MMVGLIADIGGTNVRFALVDGLGCWRDVQTYRCADFPGPVEAAQHYLTALECKPQQAAFAVASAIDGDWVAFTNSDWRFSISDVRHRLLVDHLQVVNDFTAVALSIPHLQPHDIVQIGGLNAVPDQTIAVLGPGTGLGVSGLVADGQGRWRALATEGGHVTLAATNDLERRVIEVLAKRFGHVSAERVLSGPGLVNLYQALVDLNKGPALYTAADVITRHALDQTCSVCRQALDLFFAFLGNVAGNLALSLGARGGVYLAGGILPRMTDALRQSAFRQSFEAKGRFQSYLSDIPVWLMVHPQPAFAGLAALVCRV